MLLPASDRLPVHQPYDSNSAGIVGLISIEESFASHVEAAGREVPWEILVADWTEDSSSLRCDQVVADVDRLAQELAAEFTALFGTKFGRDRTC